MQAESKQDAGTALKSGETMTLRYRVIVHPGRFDADRLNREYERFVGRAR